MGENYRNKQWLKQKHLKEKLSFRDIGKLEGVTERIITYWCKKLGIENNRTTVKKKHYRNNPLLGGSGKVSCVCQFCKHKKYMVDENPTMKEVELWLKSYKCSKCKKKRIMKI